MVQKLASKEHGWHFNATNAHAEQIQDFRIEDMIESIQACTPELWNLVISLLSGGDAFDESLDMDAEAGQVESTEGSTSKPLGVQYPDKDEQRALTIIQSYRAIEALAHTRLVSWAFDNFDIKFRTLIPTIDSPGDDDLRCSNLIWNRQDLRLNPKATDPRVFNPLRTLELLYSLHPQSPHASGLSRRGRFNSWFIRRALFQHGPTWFRQCSSLLRDPEAVEAIPICKMHQVPFSAMDINPASVAGNIQVIEELIKQSGLEDIVDDPTKLDDLAVPTHGDLGSFEHILSVLKVRSIEMTPAQRLQFIIFIIGLFHLKMAAADAVWRVLVGSTKGSTADTTSFMKYVGILRPNETSKLSSNPEFRQQHELIEQVLNVLILDAWRTEIKKRFNRKYQSLDAYAATRPSMAELEEIADVLARDYVAGEADDQDLYSMRMAAASDRDQQKENTLLALQLLLLYQELSYAMNAGDIGRVETLYAPWIQVFRATGKHKYGNRLLLFNHNLYFVYPDRFRRAIRLNMLVNPTGKPHEFRAVDWVVELLNLYIKYIYGGEGSNYTKKRILMESPLVLLFRSSHANFERNFQLTGLTTRHAQKNMTEMYSILLKYMTEQGPNEVRTGRKSAASLPDSLSHGASVLLAESVKHADDGLEILIAEDGEELEVSITENDVSVEDFM
ncbi:hypothetical protein EIP86_004312 [Pleurotus ostreatoroseus]|nr:hypothetical protein EIP86_004312 [Pleurotus ostreatoroseus]